MPAYVQAPGADLLPRPVDYASDEYTIYGCKTKPRNSHSVHVVRAVFVTNKGRVFVCRLLSTSRVNCDAPNCRYPAARLCCSSAALRDYIALPATVHIARRTAIEFNPNELLQLIRQLPASILLSPDSPFASHVSAIKTHVRDVAHMRRRFVLAKPVGAFSPQRADRKDRSARVALPCASDLTKAVAAEMTLASFLASRGRSAEKGRVAPALK